MNVRIRMMLVVMTTVLGMVTAGPGIAGPDLPDPPKPKLPHPPDPGELPGADHLLDPLGLFDHDHKHHHKHKHNPPGHSKHKKKDH